MIYISLTTVPKRLKYWPSIEINLKSLLYQKTNKEYFVVFNIPKLYVMDDNAEYIIPDELFDFVKKHPNLIINRDIYDYGPIIKIYGGLQYATDPNDVIIAVDDDNLYHEDMLERHIEKLNQYPNHVVCYASDCAVKRINFVENNIKKFKLESHTINYPLDNDEYVKNPGHNGSVSYKRYYLQNDFNPDLFLLADGDDPLMGYYLKKHQIPIICASYDIKYRKTCTAFPIVIRLGYPEYCAGYLIRQKHPQTIHGYIDDKVLELLDNNDYIYTEKN